MLPWLAMLQAGVAASERWQALSEKERHHFVTLLRDSRGWPGRLSERDRDELRRLIRKLDLAGVGRDMLPLARGGRRRR